MLLKNPQNTFGLAQYRR